MLAALISARAPTSRRDAPFSPWRAISAAAASSSRSRVPSEAIPPLLLAQASRRAGRRRRRRTTNPCETAEQTLGCIEQTFVSTFNRAAARERRRGEGREQ